MKLRLLLVVTYNIISLAQNNDGDEVEQYQVQALPQDFDELCGPPNECCQCSNTEGACSLGDEGIQDGQCDCGESNIYDYSLYQPRTCLIDTDDFQKVYLGTQQQLDLAQILTLSTPAMYELLQQNLTFVTLGLIQGYIEEYYQSIESTVTLDWYLRMVECMQVRLNGTNASQTDQKQFVFNLFDLIRRLLYRQYEIRSRNPKFNFYSISLTNFTAYIAPWQYGEQQTLPIKKMKLGDEELDAAMCNYTWRTVLISYTVAIVAKQSFMGIYLNETFDKFDSHVTYCMFLNKHGQIYTPPSSSLHFSIYIPDYSFELSQELLQAEGYIKQGFYCYQVSQHSILNIQIKQVAAEYRIVLNNQQCAYVNKGKKDYNPLPFCACNEPGINFLNYNNTKFGSLMSFLILTLLGSLW